MSLVEALVLLAIIALAVYVMARSPKRPRGQASETQSSFFGVGGWFGGSGGGDSGGFDSGGGGGGGDGGGGGAG